MARLLVRCVCKDATPQDAWMCRKADTIVKPIERAYPVVNGSHLAAFLSWLDRGAMDLPACFMWGCFTFLAPGRFQQLCCFGPILVLLRDRFDRQ